MLIQDYKAQSLKKVISRQDVRNWDLWSNRHEMNLELAKLERSIRRTGFNIGIPQRGHHNGFQTFQSSRAVDHVALKMTDYYIRRIYRVKQSDRSRIIREIRALIEDSGSLSIIREDVRSFYDSIPFDQIIQKIEGDLILYQKGVSILQGLNRQLSQLGYQGLPRGIGVSATLSELYTEAVDKYMSSRPEVFYYARYVDDVFILTENQSATTVREILCEKLDQIGLSLHTGSHKSLCQQTMSANFSYLGYHFITTVNSKRKPTTEVSIAPEKVKKIKRRIIKSFVAFQREHSFINLINRLRYLSCNKIVKKSVNGDVLSGLKYNYCEVSTFEKFKVFDGFLISILDNNRRLTVGLTAAQKQQIRQISFFRAAKRGIVAKYSRRKVDHIKLAWINE